MKDTLVVDRRLAWPPVLLGLFLCVAIVSFDLVWRSFTISAEWLLLSFAAVLLIGCGAIVVAARMKPAVRR